MWGQWIGFISGTNNGSVMLNIDADSPNSGKLIVFDYDKINVSFSVDIHFEVDERNLIGKLSNFSLISYSVDPSKRAHEQSLLPSTGIFTGILDQIGETGGIDGSWVTNNNTSGEMTLYYYDNFDIRGSNHTFTWDEYRIWALEEKKKNKGLVFRGHSDCRYVLQTSFHRYGRRDLLRYSYNHVHELSRYISATLGRAYSVNNATEHGELLYLAQHHGYPTPFLDWTESPFVAAYFAYHNLIKYSELTECIRIYVFDEMLWHKKYERVTDINVPLPAISTYRFDARDNKRALPQQSLVTFTNISNVEEYIRTREKEDGAVYLQTIDIKQSERNSVMQDLAIMGVTASSLFPGLDGVCAELREKHF